MLRIAICDDDLQELTRITNILEIYRIKNNTILTYKLFQNGLDLLEAISGGEYDILLLDILMPGINGIQVAHEIRSFDKEVKIIFLTSSPEFAAESYSVEAYYYLIKPSSEERIFPLLNKILYEATKPIDSIMVKLQSSILRIDYEKLEFVEVFNKKILFHLSNNIIETISGTLSQYEKELLSHSEFIKVHRSYIVNMHWINKIDSKEITTYNQKKIPISRLLYSHVRERYMKYLFVEKGVE